jgi:hypothetical protein
MSEIKILETKDCVEVSLDGSRVRVTPFRNGRYTGYRVNWKVGDRFFRKARSNKAEAIEMAKEKVRHLSRADGERTTVDTQHLVYLRECERSVYPHKLHEVCDFFRKFHVVGGPKKTLNEVCEEYKAVLTQKNLSKVYTHTVTTQSKVLKAWFGPKTLPSITAKEIEMKLLESSFSPYTKRKLLNFYRSLENFAKKRRYLPRDYDTVTEAVTLPSLPKMNYPVFTPEELARLFILLRPHEIPYVATMAFGGSRRAEFARMTSAHFDSEEQTAKIDRVIAKKTLPRNLHMPVCLRDWLDIAEMPEKGHLISHRKIAAISRDKSRLAQVGLAWKQNILRHSFLSYHLALHENPGVTAYVGGTSIKMLNAHYVTLVSKRAAEEWFNINPLYVRKYAENNNLTQLITW